VKNLNFVDGDIQLDSAGNLAFVIGAESLRQKIESRLELWRGSWFLDARAGVPWVSQILGHGQAALADRDVGRLLAAELLKEPEVLSILDSESIYDAASRHFTFKARVDTIYGTLEVGV